MSTSAVQQFSAQETALVFTDQAACKVLALIKEEQNHDLKLRVFVTGGGCSGLQYGFTFDESINDGDTVIEKKCQDDEDEGDEGGGVVRLVIDPMSYQYLMGAEIDYKKDLYGEQFVIRNPNAQTTCGCGSSFSV